MKNLPLIFSGVLLIAVGILYYLHFSRRPAASGQLSPSLAGDLKIAFVNSDTILKYYDYFKVNREKLESKSKKLDQDLRNRAQSFQSEVESYQRGQDNLTRGQAKAVEDDLAKKQQNLQLYQQSLSQELSNDETKLLQSLYLKITTFLKKYGQERGYYMIFKFDSSSDVLFGSEPLNITREVVDGLNAEYKLEKTSGGNKKDSTSAPAKK